MEAADRGKISPTVAPCRDCPDRQVGCHADCEKYKAWRADLDALNEQKRQEEAHRAYRHEKRVEFERSLWKSAHYYKQHFRKTKPVNKAM